MAHHQPVRATHHIIHGAAISVCAQHCDDLLRYKQGLARGDDPLRGIVDACEVCRALRPPTYGMVSLANLFAMHELALTHLAATRAPDSPHDPYAYGRARGRVDGLAAAILAASGKSLDSVREMLIEGRVSP